jgi:hypothetical protein
MRAILCGIAVLLGCTPCVAQQVYLFRTGVPERDAALHNALQAHGLQVTLGAPYQAFDGSQNLSGYHVAVLAGTGVNDAMPLNGQQALLDWVGGGRGLVTLEWTLWSVSRMNGFLILRELFPATYQRHAYRSSIQYLQQASDPILNQGLPAALMLGEGHEAHLRPKQGATVYYASDYLAGAGGVVGWAYQSGRVISLSVAPAYALNPMAQNPTFQQLLTNAVRWAARNACASAKSDVDSNGCVDNADLLQTLAAFGTVEPNPADVNCDGIVDDADLLEVLFAFGSGC